MKVKICIVMSTYNQDITNEIRFSAKKKLNEFGIKKVRYITHAGR